MKSKVQNQSQQLNLCECDDPRDDLAAERQKIFWITESKKMLLAHKYRLKRALKQNENIKHQKHHWLSCKQIIENAFKFGSSMAYYSFVTRSCQEGGLNPLDCEKFILEHLESEGFEADTLPGNIIVIQL